MTGLNYAFLGSARANLQDIHA